MKKITIFVLAALLGMSVLSQFTWIRKWHAKVECDGSSVNSARVYRNWAGDVLVDLSSSGEETYVIRDGSVGIPNKPAVIEFGPFAFAKSRRLKTVALGTAKTGFIKPKLLQDSQSLSFTNENGKKILVAWN